MIMRRRDTCFFIHMCEDLKAEFSILVQYLQAARYVVATIFLDEIFIVEQAFEIEAHPLAAGGARIAIEGCAAIGDELLEIVSHGVVPVQDLSLTESNTSKRLFPTTRDF